MTPVATSTHTLGADTATLTVKTRRGGAAAKAGHDLEIVVKSWEATLDLGDAPSLSVTVDPRSLQVVKGTGGIQALDDDDKANIQETIDSDVLKGAPIAFRSSSITPADGGLDVSGELELAGARHPLTFTLKLAGGRLTGAATVKQTEWGMKPYSALFGTLKVLDEVEVRVDAAFTQTPPERTQHG